MFATAIDAVREILEFGQLTPLPQTPPFVRGVMNLRGAVVPVIDIGARFGGHAAEVGRRTCIVVVEIDAEPTESEDDERTAPSHVVGMLVDAVYEVFEVASADLEPVPPMGTCVAPEYLRAMARVRGQACAVLDLDHLLAQGTLADLIAQHPAAS
jgi:purine-binding chemotaxis protein CheW